MPFPDSPAELAKAGYEFDGVGACRGCQAEIHWYVRPTKNRGERSKMPFSRLENGRMVPHFARCPERAAFKAANDKHQARAGRKKPEQKSLF